MFENKRLDTLKFDIKPYKEALDLQFSLVEKRQNEEVNDTLVLLQHPPVITYGKRTDGGDILLPDEAMKRLGVELFPVGRGGEATYHGPGQIVGYPIINLYRFERSVKKFVHTLEDVFIALLNEEFDIPAKKDPDHIGVWVGDEKITAIGIAVKRGVTMHGFAFNVNTDLSHFNWIVPCGIRDKGVTSMEKILGEPQDMDRVTGLVDTYFRRTFKYEQ